MDTETEYVKSPWSLILILPTLSTACFAWTAVIRYSENDYYSAAAFSFATVLMFVFAVVCIANMMTDRIVGALKTNKPKTKLEQLLQE